MYKTLLDIMVCPNCHGKLKLTKDDLKLVCTFDKLVFSIKDGIPEMLIESAQSLSLDAMDKMEFK